MGQFPSAPFVNNAFLHPVLWPPWTERTGVPRRHPEQPPALPQPRASSCPTPARVLAGFGGQEPSLGDAACILGGCPDIQHHWGCQPEREPSSKDGTPEIEDVARRSSTQRRPLFSQAAESHTGDFCGAALGKGSVRLNEQRA